MGELLSSYGYKEGQDYIFRNHAPIVLTKFDLAAGRYSDMYGNTVEGYKGVVSEIVLRGCNNHIIFGSGVKHTENLNFDLTSNAYIRIGSGCNFTQEMVF